jgi:hypothetical protein
LGGKKALNHAYWEGKDFEPCVLGGKDFTELLTAFFIGWNTNHSLRAVTVRVTSILIYLWGQNKNKVTGTHRHAPAGTTNFLQRYWHACICVCVLVSACARVCA